MCIIWQIYTTEIKEISNWTCAFTLFNSPSFSTLWYKSFYFNRIEILCRIIPSIVEKPDEENVGEEQNTSSLLEVNDQSTVQKDVTKEPSFKGKSNNIANLVQAVFYKPINTSILTHSSSGEGLVLLPAGDAKNFPSQKQYVFIV